MTLDNNIEEGVFWHECEEAGCTRSVEFDDEPKCFLHSQSDHVKLYGYSAYEKEARKDK